MKSLAVAALLFTSTLVTPAQADWRWAKPVLKEQKIAYFCDTMQCLRRSYIKEKKKLHRKIVRYNQRRLREWRYWTSLYIPDCTWYGESGYGPKYARYRYTMWNSGGSTAYGKFQFMSNTYHNRAKYHDWSALDQEIAARREYWANGTGPWTNCY